MSLKIAVRGAKWNQLVLGANCSPAQKENAVKARAWYLQHRNLKPGEAANKIAAILNDENRNTPVESRTIIKWIEDLALPQLKSRGRPVKK